MTFKDMMDTLMMQSYSSDLTISKICMTLAVSLIISLYIFWAYQKQTQNEFYSKNFNISLPLMSVVTTGIILAMQSNLVISLGMVGALSIVRYRTAIKSPLDLFFLFWAISVGIVCGAGQYVLALIMSVVVDFLLTILSNLDVMFVKILLIVKCDKTTDTESLEKDIRQEVKLLKTKSKQVTKDGAEMIFEFVPKKGTDVSKMLQNKKEIKEFHIISNN